MPNAMVRVARGARQGKAGQGKARQGKAGRGAMPERKRPAQGGSGLKVKRPAQGGSGLCHIRGSIAIMHRAMAFIVFSVTT